MTHRQTMWHSLVGRKVTEAEMLGASLTLAAAFFDEPRLPLVIRRTPDARRSCRPSSVWVARSICPRRAVRPEDSRRVRLDPAGRQPTEDEMAELVRHCRGDGGTPSDCSGARPHERSPPQRATGTCFFMATRRSGTPGMGSAWLTPSRRLRRRRDTRVLRHSEGSKTSISGRLLS